jgi:ABC-type maltose transport system permease subunit
MQQFIMSILDELLCAASIDSFSEVGIFFRIALPLARSGLTTGQSGNRRVVDTGVALKDRMR